MVEKKDQPQPSPARSEHELEVKILARRSNDIGQDENIALTNRHYEIVQATGQEFNLGEESEHQTRLELLQKEISGTMLGIIDADFWDPPMPEVESSAATEFLPDSPYQKLETAHYEAIRLVRETFSQRFITIRIHLIDQILATSQDKNLRLGLRALIFESENGFFDDVTEYLKVQTQGVFPNSEQQALIASHQRESDLQKRLLERKLRSLDKKFAYVITKASAETVNQIHRDFVGGLQDALDLFKEKNLPLTDPIVRLLSEYKKQAQAAPGEEILKAVRKMYILSTYDQEKAGSAFLTKFTLTRALVLGVIKNYWESSGESIIDFQNKLKTWWVTHVNRPKVDENGQITQEINSPMINGELGSYFTMFSLEDQKLELLNQSRQVDAVAILARQQLLSTLVDQNRNLGLDIIDGWTHTDMPHQARYSIVVHQGTDFKKFIFPHDQLQDLDSFLESFNQQFADQAGWQKFALNQEQAQRAIEGKTTVQEAELRKFDLSDPTVADTSVVLLKADEQVMAEDIVQRGSQSWTHGPSIKFSLTLFVDETGRLTGKGAQKGSHAWTDGRVSTIKLQNSLIEACTLLEIQTAETRAETQLIDYDRLTNGSENLRPEQEARLQIAKFDRQKYQPRIQKLFEFFRDLNPPEARFNFDINGLVSAAVLMTLNDIWKVAGKKEVINNIQFLERAKFVRSGVQIGDSLTPVPLQFNDGMQDGLRHLAMQIEQYRGDLKALAQGENRDLDVILNQLQRQVLAFAFFDEERKIVRSGNPGVIAVMAEMAGKARRPLTFASKITSPELTDMAINTVLISSLLPSKPRETSADNDINIESFSTAMDEVYKNFGFVIAASSYGQGNKETVSVVVRQIREVISPVLEKYAQVMGKPVDLQTMLEINLNRVLLLLETFQDQYQQTETAKHD